MQEATPKPKRWPAQTDADIQAEVALLWKLTIIIPQKNLAGRENRKAIEAQLSILSALVPPPGTAAEFSTNDTENHVFRAAMRASMWLGGIGEPPSGHWVRAIGRATPNER
jgi:hypothetical protein